MKPYRKELLHDWSTYRTPPRHKALSRAYEPLVSLSKAGYKKSWFPEGGTWLGGVGSPAMSNLPDEFRDVFDIPGPTFQVDFCWYSQTYTVNIMIPLGSMYGIRDTMRGGKTGGLVSLG